MVTNNLYRLQLANHSAIWITGCSFFFFFWLNILSGVYFVLSELWSNLAELVRGCFRTLLIDATAFRMTGIHVESL